MVTSEQKEQCITYIKEKYPKVKRARACKLLNCSRSKAYYKKKMPVKDAPIKAAIEKVIGHSLKGRKKIIPLVQMQHPEMGSSKIRRVYEQNDLQLTKNPKKRKRSDGKNQAEVPMKANEEWDIDFMHDTLAEGKTIRSLNVIDPYNRECKGMSIRYSFAARRVIEFLDRLIEIYGKPKYIRSDNGPEFISKVFQLWLKKREIGWRNIQRGKPAQNCFVERFNRTAREELFDANLFFSLDHANELAQAFRYDYNHNRPHESLGNKTPINYAA